MPKAETIVKHELAAQMLVDGEFTLQQIAEKVGVTISSVWRWKQKPDFMAKVGQMREELRTKIRESGIAVRADRVRAKQDRWMRMRRVIEERALDAMSDPEMMKVPGAATGLLVKQYKMVGKEKMVEVCFDAALAAEMRAIEKEAAQDLGQWEEKHQHSGIIGFAIDQNVKITIDYDRVAGQMEQFAVERATSRIEANNRDESVHPGDADGSAVVVPRLPGP